MKDGYKITDAEQEIMQVLWEIPGSVLTRELLEKVNAGKRNWKRQTLNTLLFRLEEKGIVERRRAYVKAALSREELRQRQTQEILNEFYDGNLSNFCVALIGNARIKEEEVERLNALIDELQKQ